MTVQKITSAPTPNEMISTINAIIDDKLGKDEKASSSSSADSAATLSSTLPINRGGTGATTESNARANLGLSTAVTGASISGKVITLTFADGTTKTLTTQDTVNSYTGAVSQKHNSTFNVTNTVVTKTVSGLTKNKPVYWSIKNTNNAYVYVGISAGVALTSSTDGLHATNISCAYSAANHGVVIPTGTSITFAIEGNNTTAKSTTLVVYQ